MTKTKKSLWSRLPGANSDCGCCCGTIVEEIPENEKEKPVKQKKDTAEKKATSAPK